LAIRDIVFGEDNEALRKVSREVKNINLHIITLLDDMKETLFVEDGGGLAAPQVGVLRRIAVISYDDKYYEIINPKIISESGELIEEEGCLSLPDIWGPVKRPETIKVSYLDRNGDTQDIEATGMLARIFCHEIDHLNGILFVDKMIEENE
jgi:peptide deformylase